MTAQLHAAADFELIAHIARPNRNSVIVTSDSKPRYMKQVVAHGVEERWAVERLKFTPSVSVAVLQEVEGAKSI